ncbi:hypothetical protein [Enterococcus hirae]|uniref:hypothetical protein n=1 Tax=Enterococcus hirae TaxID=1354 RepID=UPI00136DCE14|nr:hypothetical protein [Enterococcus hirae]NAE18237.1 hypothetical protein [Enterococcus hirae]
MPTDKRDLCPVHGVKHRTDSDAAKRCAADLAEQAETSGPRLEQLPLVEIHADDLRWVLNYRGRIDRIGGGITPVSLSNYSPVTLVDWREIEDMLTWCPDLNAAAERLTAWANEPVEVTR